MTRPVVAAVGQLVGLVAMAVGVAMIGLWIGGVLLAFGLGLLACGFVLAFVMTMLEGDD